MIVLDTTVLIYAHGRDHSLREPCRSVMFAVAEGRVAATTTVEVIQDHWSRTRDRSSASRLAGLLVEALAPLIAVTQDDLSAGLRLFSRVKSLGAFDCVLAAAARRREVEAIVSTDSAFAEVPGIDHIDPGRTGDLVRIGIVAGS